LSEQNLNKNCAEIARKMYYGRAKVKKKMRGGRAKKCERALWGNGNGGDDTAGEYKQGDRVGVLLGLDSGSLCFFKNGVEHGPGYAAGSVTGPVVAAVHLYTKDERVRLLPNAEAPAGV
jgi:hypothetical protein